MVICILHLVYAKSGNFTAESHVNLQRQHLLSMWGYDLFGQLDNAPPHRSQVYLAFIEKEGILTIPGWTAMSLGINIIENVWKVIKDRLQKATIETLDELWSFMGENKRVLWAIG